MYLKLLGGVMIIISSGLLGISIANKYTGRPRELRNFRRSLQLLETEILYGATPLPQAFKYISSKLNDYLGDFYLQVSVGISSKNCSSFSSVWSEKINQMENSNLSKGDKELMLEFGYILGTSDRLDQEKHFKLIYKQLELFEEQAEEEKKKSEKMYRSLGFLFGIMIFVVLL